MDASPPYPVPVLRTILDGGRMAGGYGFVDLFSTNPKRGLILTPPDLGQRIAAPPPAVAFFPADATSGVPFVRLRIDTARGIALADVSLQSFIDAADGFRQMLITTGALFPRPPANLAGSSGPGLGNP